MSDSNQRNSNGRGGRRANAGRKPGSATKKTREIADRAAEQGITPLEVMLETMHELVKRAKQGDPKNPNIVDMIAASAIAKDASPYVHPKLAAIELSGGVTVRTLAEELAELNAQRNAEDSPSVA